MDMINNISKIFYENGATRFYAKILSANDNSKNQIYLGSNFSSLNIIPHGEIRLDTSERAGSKRDRPKANVEFYWVDDSGIHKAPHCQLILYPDYPEVRLSGFLKGCRSAPSHIMRERLDGRVLFFGITDDGRVLAHAVAGTHPLARELENNRNLPQIGVFLELPPLSGEASSRDKLLKSLKSIYEEGWVQSQKLGRDGIARRYIARNGGGYTLEALLGVSPNSYSEPDYLGWEIKQYAVDDFEKYRPKSPITLLTPEPNGGVYQEHGPEDFLQRYGYADKSGKENRRNFGGIYACNRAQHKDTGLRLRMIGYDHVDQKILDLSGGIALLDQHDTVAAIWNYTSIIAHWNRKHAQAAYIPSMFQTPPPSYRYGPKILLCEETDLGLFLRAFSEGEVYYDPGIKLEIHPDGIQKIKRRSQFRIKHKDLTKMYHRHEVFDLSRLDS